MNTKKIGDFIRQLREEKKLSQNQLAEKIFVSRTLVNKWESGKITITSPNLKLLSDFFKVSSDEILAGERKNEQNKEIVENIGYKLYDENTKLKHKFKIIVYIIVSIVILFLIYFFITFYNSVSVYTINVKSNDVEINNGLLIKTRDKIYLRLEPNILNEDEIKTISLYYKTEEKNEIYRGSVVDTISINDFYDIQEYFDFNRFNEIKNNLYIEIEFIKRNSIETKLNIKKDYINSDIFISYKEKNSKVNNSESENKLEQIYKKYNEQVLNIKFKNQTYEITVLENNIIVNYNNISIIYTDVNLETLQRKELDKEIYLFDISSNICSEGDCKDFKKDYELLENLIDKLIM